MQKIDGTTGKTDLQSPPSLLLPPTPLRAARRRARNALGHYGNPRSSIDHLRILPPFNLLHSDLAFNELVHIRHDNGALDVHQSKGRCGVSDVRASEKEG